jgi:hypothetical protein
MTDNVPKKPEGRQNSYVKDSGAAATPEAPDIQQPGPAGDFGNDAAQAPAGNSTSTALPSKHSAGRTPGNQPELAHQSDEGVAEHPADAAEPSNPYSGT